MEGTADVHHHVATPGVPDPHGRFAPAAAFDAALDRFAADAPSRALPMTRFLGAWSHLPPWRLHRWHDLDAVSCAGVKACVWPELTPYRQCSGWAVSETLVRPTARMCRTQDQNPPDGIDPPEVFEPVPLVLAAITRVLCRRVVGARAGSLGAIMTKRGTTAGVAGWPASPGEGSGGGCDHSTPRRSHQASTRRQGASPKARRV